MLLVRGASDRHLATADVSGRGIATPHALRRLAVQLDQLGVVHVGAESILYRVQIRLVAVRGELDAIGEPRLQVADERHGVLAIAAANHVGNDQLRFGLDARPRPYVGRLGKQRLTDKSVCDLVKSYAERIGLNAADFGAHSLRAGFLTSAARRGASVFKMRDVSRHK